MLGRLDRSGLRSSVVIDIVGLLPLFMVGPLLVMTELADSGGIKLCLLTVSVGLSNVDFSSLKNQKI